MSKAKRPKKPDAKALFNLTISIVGVPRNAHPLIRDIAALAELAFRDHVAKHPDLKFECNLLKWEKIR